MIDISSYFIALILCLTSVGHTLSTVSNHWVYYSFGFDQNVFNAGYRRDKIRKMKSEGLSMQSKI